MTTNKVFSDWDETHSALWGHQPIQLAHDMHKSPLFSPDQLARLIENYPREHYSLVQTGARGSARIWREGEIGNLSGHQVIDAISRGGLCLNMRDVGAVDRRYRNMLDGMFEEVGAKVPDFSARDHQESILISAPDAQVYYHFDLPGQALIQIAGTVPGADPGSLLRDGGSQDDLGPDPARRRIPAGAVAGHRGPARRGRGRGGAGPAPDRPRFRRCLR